MSTTANGLHVFRSAKLLPDIARSTSTHASSSPNQRKELTQHNLVKTVTYRARLAMVHTLYSKRRLVGEVLLHTAPQVGREASQKYRLSPPTKFGLVLLTIAFSSPLPLRCPPRSHRTRNRRVRGHGGLLSKQIPRLPRPLRISRRRAPMASPFSLTVLARA